MDDIVTEASSTPIRSIHSNRRLNLGAGSTHIQGFENLDIKSGNNIYPLEYPDGTIDVIRASHVLEHFSHHDVPNVLRNWAAKLRPGGLMKIAVPDFAWIAQKYVEQERVPLHAFLMGGQVDEHDFHKCMFDFDSLRQLMADAGLERIGRWESEIEDCADLPVSLNLQGFKPTSAPQLQGKVCAVLSSPRFGPTMHWQSAVSSFFTLKIPYYPMQGAFWHQVLTQVIERVMGDHELIITCDYDSVFRAHDVMELIRLMQAYPEVDALMPLQFRRMETGFLGYRSEKVTPMELRKDIIAMDAGHFGLTVLRTSALKKLNKPWFMPVPDESGSWGKDRQDADVYFWRRFAEQGFNLFLAPSVRIGHMQELVAFPDENLQVQYIPLSEYERHGVPAFVPTRIETDQGQENEKS